MIFRKQGHLLQQLSSKLTLSPIFSNRNFHNKRHFQGSDIFHDILNFTEESRLHDRGLRKVAHHGFGGSYTYAGVLLKASTWIMANLIRSAAVPCKGVLIARRSAAARKRVLAIDLRDRPLATCKRD